MEEGIESCNLRKVELGSMGRNYKEPDERLRNKESCSKLQ